MPIKIDDSRVKTYACKKATNSSKTYIPTVTTNIGAAIKLNIAITPNKE